MLDPFLQGQIIGMHKAGLKSRKIALDLAVNDRTVRAIIKRYQERGTLAPKPIPGRPRHSDRPPSSKDVAASAANKGGSAEEGEGGAMDIAIETHAPTTSTAALADGMETMVSKKTGKVIKKRGKRGPYKKREKGPVVAPPVPILIAPHPILMVDAPGADAAVMVERDDTSVIATTMTTTTMTTSLQVESVVGIEERENVKAKEAETVDMRDSGMA
ncbi:hypothetical protein KI688_001154 [Linnemannia hyalina]|uniref:Paired domain-containing protein n=1 Tax=Linnemannia hyalina TaxID=64524 RepID=A0A9P8BYN1_9FUNG|nr:hypothetical protein KI688_001154 [Linnemannia hyalina]